MVNYTNSMQQDSLLHALQHPFFLASISEPAHFERVGGVTYHLSAEILDFLDVKFEALAI